MKNKTFSQIFAKSLLVFFISLSLFVDNLAQNNASSVSPFTLIQNEAGSIDLSFGKNGISTINFGSNASAQSVVLQEDGKIIIAGHGQNNQYSTGFTIVRLNPDGSLDSSFGISGKVFTSFDYPFLDAFASSLALQKDGKIVVGGVVFDSSRTQSLALARYNFDGSLDSTFGNNGKIVNQFGYDSIIVSIAIQNDNKIIIAGYSIVVGSSPLIIVRYKANGTFDKSFGDVGIVRQSEIYPSSIILQPDGKIIVGGIGFIKIKQRNKNTFGLMRLNTDGTIDNSFGVNGTSLTEFRRLDAQISSVILQSDGKIVAAGFTTDNLTYYTNQHSTLVRYNSDGQLDITFGNSGKVITEVSTLSDSINSIKIQSDGKIIATGFSNLAEINKVEVSLLRYDTEGNLDHSFGNAGVVVTQANNLSNIANYLAIQNDGKIVVVGRGIFSNFNNFSIEAFQIFRFNNNNSSIDR